MKINEEGDRITNLNDFFFPSKQAEFFHVVIRLDRKTLLHSFSP